MKTATAVRGLRKTCRIVGFGMLIVLSATFALATPLQDIPVQSASIAGTSGTVDGGVYVAPYYISLNNGPQIGVMCNSYYNSMSIGDHWHVIVNTGTDLSNTMYGPHSQSYEQNYQQKYAEAAWLYTQLQAKQSSAGNINYAVWALFDSSVKSEPGWNGGNPSSKSPEDSAAGWYWDATQWYGQQSSSQLANFMDTVRIYTPVTLNRNGEASGIVPAYSYERNAPQEFIATPEPSSLGMLGAGLFAIGVVWRRRGTATSR